MSRRIIDYTVEIITGIFLMIIAWIVTFLLVLQVIKLPVDWLIIISIVCYVLSMIGLVLSLHGVFSAIIVKRRKPRELTTS